MNITEYLKTREKTATELARSLGVAPAMIYQWRVGLRSVPMHRCIEIEKATGGKIRCEDLRPDVDWGYLRNRNYDDAEHAS